MYADVKSQNFGIEDRRVSIRAGAPGEPVRFAVLFPNSKEWFVLRTGRDTNMVRKAIN